MEKLLRCRDFGTDCDFEACGETAEEALKTAVDHARAIHGLKDISERDPCGLGRLSRIRSVSPKAGITQVEERYTDSYLLFHGRNEKHPALFQRTTGIL